jgi:carbazole 1,9a-dioxygenase terminal dioxygenase component
MNGEQGFVDEELLKRVPRWRNYLAAKLGFRNHWYPIRFSREVPENAVVSVKLLGENILLKRVNGTVYGIKDRCIHRGVRFSHKIECYTRDTITCWYHGFTYRWDSGVLCDVIASPDTPIIGKRKVKSYPVREAKGLIFVFIGDDDFAVPDLSLDVPPMLLDEDMYVQGSSYPVKANWRLGCENGIDPLHIYIHRESRLVPNTQRSIPLGHRVNPNGSDNRVLEEEEGKPKGVRSAVFREGQASAYVPLYEGKVQGQVVVTSTKMHSTPEEAKFKRTTGDFIVVPGVLRVDNFPFYGLYQFEWYVPITEDSHLYIITIGKRCANQAERDEYDHAFWHRWKPESLEGFNNDDISAREALQPFYSKDRNWLEENLVREDQSIVKWREVCHRNARGIQLPKHVDP